MLGRKQMYIPNAVLVLKPVKLQKVTGSAMTEALYIARGRETSASRITLEHRAHRLLGVLMNQYEGHPQKDRPATPTSFQTWINV